MLKTELLKNLAVKFSTEELATIGNTIIDDFDRDVNNRQGWEDKANRQFKLWAMDVSDRKLPYPGASNVCLPILTSAANQYHSRLWQSIFSTTNIMKGLPVEPGDVERARDVERYINYQIFNEIDGYVESFDVLIQRAVIYGMCFRKLTYDKNLKVINAVTISPIDVLVPSNTIKLKDADRITHRLVMSKGILQDRFDSEDFLGEDVINIDSDGSVTDKSSGKTTSDEITGITSDQGEDFDHILLECHKKVKLPRDKKREPYTITVHKSTGKVLRITSRKLKDSNGNPVEMRNFIAYGFLPNPEGFYMFGLGHFLEELNVIINTAYNQEFDAGKLRNMPTGYYSRKFGLRNKQTLHIRPGALHEVDDPGGINFPQMQRGDGTLFNLIGMANNFSDKLTSTSDFISGVQPSGSRATARGTLALIEQGLTTFTSIAKRIYRSLREELELIYILNSLFLSEEKQFRVQGTNSDKTVPWSKIKRKDFTGKLDIITTADPILANQPARMQEIVDFSGLVGSDPLVAGDKAGRQPNRSAQRQLLKDKITAFGKDPALYLPKDGSESIDPVAENTLMAQGDFIEPLPKEDHKGHIETHRAFLNDGFGAGLDTMFQTIITDHITKHITLEGEQAQVGQPQGQGQGQQPQPQPQSPQLTQPQGQNIGQQP